MLMPLQQIICPDGEEVCGMLPSFQASHLHRYLAFTGDVPSQFVPTPWHTTKHYLCAADTFYSHRLT